MASAWSVTDFPGKLQERGHRRELVCDGKAFIWVTETIKKCKQIMIPMIVFFVKEYHVMVGCDLILINHM